MSFKLIEYVVFSVVAGGCVAVVCLQHWGGDVIFFLEELFFFFLFLVGEQH